MLSKKAKSISLISHHIRNHAPSINWGLFISGLTTPGTIQIQDRVHVPSPKPSAGRSLMWLSLSWWNCMLQQFPFFRTCSRTHNAEWAARYLAAQAWIFFSALSISDWECVFCCTLQDHIFFFLIKKSHRQSNSRILLRAPWAWAWARCNNHSYSPNWHKWSSQFKLFLISDGRKVRPCWGSDHSRFYLCSEGWKHWEDRMPVLPAKMLVSGRMNLFSPEYELFVKMLHVGLKTFLLCEVWIWRKLVNINQCMVLCLPWFL